MILSKLTNGLRALLRKSEVERELDEEVQFHLEMEIEGNVRRGMSPEEARSAALRSFGGVEQVKEECRDARGIRWLENTWQDLRYGIRMMWKTPVFTAVAALTLALGTGANSAAFSVVNAVLLRPLPYKDADRLAMLAGFDPQRGIPLTNYSIPKFNAIAEQNQVFESIAAIADDSFNLTGRNAPEQIQGARVSGDLFHVLAVKPYLGRAFLPEEDRPGGPRVVVLSYDLWRRLFGADVNIVKRAVELDGQSFAVVGVLPEDFKFLDETQDVWLPRAFEPSYFASDSINLGATYLRVVARLKSGVESTQAQSDLANLSLRYQQNYPGNSDIAGNSSLMPLQSAMVGNVRPALLVIFGIVGVVLLIACANVTNLLLARAAARRREFAVRRALGATKIQLIRQVFTESMMLSLLGGAGGILLGYLGTSVLLAAKPAGLPRLNEISLDFRVLGFTFAVSLLSGLIFGLAPALQSSEADLNETLKEGGRLGASDARGNLIRRVLVVCEIAMALVVLISAGLLTQTFLRLRQTHAGLDYHNVLTMSVTLPKTRYPEPYQQANFCKQAIERVRTLPGVTDVAVTSVIPLIGPATGFRVYIEGLPDPGSEKVPRAPGRFISSDYFRLLKIPLVAGRTFTEGDDENTAKVTIINESFARRFWPSQNPVGKRFAYSTNRILCEVVGIVKDTKFKVSDTVTREEMYFPAPQRPRLSMSLMVRTTTDPLSLASAIQNQILNVDKDQAVTEVKTLEQVVSDSIGQPRLTMLLLSVFAIVALVLATVGIYGVMAYTVAQRTHEIGIRMALGAQTSDVLKLVMRNGMRLALGGVAIGLAVALALTRLMSALLFGVTPTDAATFICISLCLLGVSLFACYIPARRATKVDPLVALR